MPALNVRPIAGRERCPRGLRYHVSGYVRRGASPLAGSAARMAASSVSAIA